jgi:hypothetical protein
VRALRRGGRGAAPAVHGAGRPAAAGAGRRLRRPGDGEGARRAPLADRLRSLLPGRRLGWALAAAFTGAPAIATIGALAWLATHPALSVQALWIFATQRIAAGDSAASGWLIETLAATRIASWLGAFGRGLATVEPGQLGVAAAALVALTGLSAWVLYRNLIRTPTRERHHVSYSF